MRAPAAWLWAVTPSNCPLVTFLILYWEISVTAVMVPRSGVLGVGVDGVDEELLPPELHPPRQAADTRSGATMRKRRDGSIRLIRLHVSGYRFGKAPTREKVVSGLRACQTRGERHSSWRGTQWMRA